jgi:hypothetical protein
MLKECKIKECHSRVQQVQLKEYETEDDHAKRWGDEVERDLNM